MSSDLEVVCRLAFGNEAAHEEMPETIPTPMFHRLPPAKREALAQLPKRIPRDRPLHLVAVSALLLDLNMQALTKLGGLDSNGEPTKHILAPPLPGDLGRALRSH